MKKTLSIVVPCYNEQEALPLFYKELSKTIKKMSDIKFEIILVNDGSKDKTLEVMHKLSSKDSKIKYISFSRNFGKEAAMLAGLDYSTGDYVTIMDADLQDPPSLLPEMVRLIEEEGYDVVGTRRVTRKGEPPIRSFFARLFYKIINKLSPVEMVDGARDYRLMTRQVVNSIIELREYNRYSKGLFPFVGYETKWLEYENINRVAGETKWSFWKLFVYAIDGIVSFSTIPLIMSATIGLIFCLLSFIFIAIIIGKTLLFGDPVAGWPSTVCIILFVAGVQLFFLGILGEYFSKAYLELKHRPIYIVKEDNFKKK